MSGKTCFVIMAIGDQTTSDNLVSASSLKSKYDDLIKEAILNARPNLDVVRADDISLPGTMTTDIITRIMHSDYVVADVTYPNPNVFYELGLRHACRTGTIIIRDRNGPKVPFDIAHLRHLEYENTSTGLKQLSMQLSSIFEQLDQDSGRPDNHFQELAKLTGYIFPQYVKEEPLDPGLQAIMGFIESPELINLFIKQQAGESVTEGEIIQAVVANPKVAQPLMQALYQSGELSFGSDSGNSTNRTRQLSKPSNQKNRKQ